MLETPYRISPLTLFGVALLFVFRAKGPAIYLAQPLGWARQATGALPLNESAQLQNSRLGPHIRQAPLGSTRREYELWMGPVLSAEDNYFVHSLLRAYNWQHRPQLDQVCQWWRDGGPGVCALIGMGGAGKKAVAGHEAVRKGLEVAIGDAPGENPSDSATLDLLEEIVHHTLSAGHVDEAWDIYWNRIGCSMNLMWRLGAYERGERICRAFAGGQPPETCGKRPETGPGLAMRRTSSVDRI